MLSNTAPGDFTDLPGSKAFSFLSNGVEAKMGGNVLKCLHWLCLICGKKEELRIKNILGAGIWQAAAACQLTKRSLSPFFFITD